MLHLKKSFGKKPLLRSLTHLTNVPTRSDLYAKLSTSAKHALNHEEYAPHVLSHAIQTMSKSNFSPNEIFVAIVPPKP